MKRPSGFDRVPEQPAESVNRPARPVEPEMVDRPAASVPEPVHAGDAPGAVGSPEADTSATSAEVGDAAAVTVDLSEVRRERAGLLRRRDEADPVRDAERQMKAAQRQLKRRERHERRRFALSSRRRRRWWLISGSVVLALALFVLIGVFTPVMSVRNIEVVGAESVNSHDIAQALDRFSGTPLALVDEKEVRGALEPFPLIQRYAIERIPPNTLLVRIEERVPVISIERDGVFLQYDAAGVLVGSAEAPPVGAPLAGGRVTDLGSEAFASAAAVLRDMPQELREQVLSVSAASGQDVLLQLSNGAEVMWGGSEDTARKAVLLATMLGSLSDIAVSYIDVSSIEAPVFR